MHNELYYLVDWLEYMLNDPTWRLAMLVGNTLELVQEFHHSCYPYRPSPSSCIATLKTRGQSKV